ncbi:hypothetical protein [Campylobacter pinnipediorum]|uniref:hypothetical protein n=1 Tax=Campylobacter pinnipediorum TaxID=1965231 RepID=UPI00130107DB|nr:hypothetical protein [Campylobacter pinnipediorum]
MFENTYNHSHIKNIDEEITLLQALLNIFNNNLKILHYLDELRHLSDANNTDKIVLDIF